MSLVVPRDASAEWRPEATLDRSRSAWSTHQSRRRRAPGPNDEADFVVGDEARDGSHDPVFSAEDVRDLRAVFVVVAIQSELTVDSLARGGRWLAMRLATNRPACERQARLGVPLSG